MVCDIPCYTRPDAPVSAPAPVSRDPLSRVYRRRRACLRALGDTPPCRTIDTREPDTVSRRTIDASEPEPPPVWDPPSKHFPKTKESLDFSTRPLDHQTSGSPAPPTMADIEPPTKRICLVAPKGSVANNPCRKLPSDVLANIKAMTSDKHPPTPTALLMKDLIIDHEAPDDESLLVVNLHSQCAAGVHFKQRSMAYHTEGHVSPTYSLDFPGPWWGSMMGDLREWRSPELGVVRTPNWIQRRHQGQSFEDALGDMLHEAYHYCVTDWSVI